MFSMLLCCSFVVFFVLCNALIPTLSMLVVYFVSMCTFAFILIIFTYYGSNMVRRAFILNNP